MLTKKNFKQQRTTGKKVYISEQKPGIINIPNWQTLIIARLSFFDKKNPSLSGIICSKSHSAENDTLYIKEVYNLDLNAQLVVLSSCESGMGEYIKGEGLMGLNSSFLYAGANNIIASLWRSEDARNKKLMLEFFTQVIEGKSFSEALRLAKLKLIKTPSDSSPVFWSPFILIGQ